jgi:ribosomal protein S18 acetylase RimI-like enzyme
MAWGGAGPSAGLAGAARALFAGLAAMFKAYGRCRRVSVAGGHKQMDAGITVSASTTLATDVERAVAVIVLAFSSDPVARWTYPDPHDYLTHFPGGVRAFGGKAFAHGTGHHLNGFAGAALWLAPGVLPDEEALGAVVMGSVAEARQAEVFGVFERMGSYHPLEPHWYLPLIGVDPAHQRKGYGSVLLHHALSRCDRDHVAAYLESSNPANIPLYQRHGFEVLDTIQVGSSPPIFPMLRPAR